MKIQKYQLSLKYLKKSLIRRYENVIGIDFLSDPTLEEAKSIDPKLSYGYMPTNGKALTKVLKDLNISNTDRILDIGCGKGYAIKNMLPFPFEKIDGVEILESYAKIAKKNFEKMKTKNVSIFFANAIDFQYYDDYNYFFFFNPFPGPIMEQVLKLLIFSISRNPREIKIIYNGPEFHEKVINTKIFILVKEYTYKKNWIKVYKNISSNLTC